MKNNSASIRYILFLFIALSLFFGNNLMAQENGIYEVTQKGKSDKEYGKGANKMNNDRTEFYNLAFNLHPTYYFENNFLKTSYDSGNLSKLTFEDAKSSNIVKNEDPKYDQVELITIALENISDLKNSIDLSKDKNLKKLKYVYIKCYFNCSEDDIKKFIQTDKNVRIFYSNIIGG
ncbi:hypothetical protein [Yeosuana aromativorans]|nr:hypothetical protein [Yeosuana aromativorans]